MWKLHNKGCIGEVSMAVHIWSTSLVANNLFHISLLMYLHALYKSSDCLRKLRS